MEDMIKMLADAPQEQRKQMITERLKMIAGQPEPQRIESVKGLILAVSKLDEKKKAPFIADRTQAIAQLAPEQRSALMVTRAKVGPQLPEDVSITDMKYTVMAVKQWPEEKRNMFVQDLKKAFEATNMPIPDFEAMMK